MYQSRRDNLLIVVLIIIILLAAGNIFYQRFNSEQDEIKVQAKTQVNSNHEIENKKSNFNQKKEEIVVHLGGEVLKPGVYYCAADSRLYKILKKAGGPTNKADLNAINLAIKVRDGQKIIIPSLTKSNSSQGPNAKININTAKQSQLEEINGVGPATAKKIINYRQDNGRFKSIDSLTEVSGIGPKTLEKVKEKITY
ncbi:helix-hairpin-helix domain-containing protein [Halanaerobacter jeridensis]|uniref:Competence protein ComEA n=1 Tax=Halanaerobacter jeridensis TaxID=706427 RepID=A0A938XSU5_9FIRM|nr:helix-hairpin-helix domain-containing protein [Halanaerobacter jeridensis]MBM7556219.1 competence protein ComEA [Halanaerobacter jeridensis]